MEWRDVAAIIFACTAVNHLGLIAAIERVIRRRMPVINCPKCLTCWSVMAYGIVAISHDSPQDLITAVPLLLATSLLSSYLAIWLELLMYFIDTLYNMIYGTVEKIAEESRDEDASGNE